LRFSSLVILAALAGTVHPAAAARVLNRTAIALVFHPKAAVADGEPCLLLAQPIHPRGTRLSEFGSRPRTG
jgi:hypothetical protein